MELYCGKCDYNIPVQLTHAGPHIKALCGKCGAYIKFVHIATIPHFKDSRAKIWTVTQDLELIKAAKLACGVHEDLKGLDRSIAFQNLYSYIIKEHFT